MRREVMSSWLRRHVRVSEFELYIVFSLPHFWHEIMGASLK